MDAKEQEKRFFDLLFELKSMGFSDSHCRRALQGFDLADRHVLEHCIQWMTDNPETEEQRRMVLEGLVIPLANMGFSRYVTAFAAETETMLFARKHTAWCLGGLLIHPG